LFVVEEGDNRVRAIVRVAQGEDPRIKVSICDLAHPECVSALRQMLERGAGGRRGISSATLRRTLPEVASMTSRGSVFGVVPASDVMRQAADLAIRHQLKGADCVHMAAAQHVRQRVAEGEEFWFVSADVRQAAAAHREGMPVLDPST
jgi:predicted nucleic acid-binding protein